MDNVSRAVAWVCNYSEQNLLCQIEEFELEEQVDLPSGGIPLVRPVLAVIE